MVDVDDLVKHSKRMHLKVLREKRVQPKSRNEPMKEPKASYKTVTASTITLPGLDMDTLDTVQMKQDEQIHQPHQVLTTEALTKSLESVRALKKIKREIQGKKEHEKLDRSIRRQLLKN